jgi:ParB-like chromosome segregation protein Spo0J
MTQVPVRFMPLDEDQAAALALADNRLSEITPWDDEGLAEVLRDLEGASFDLDGLGWTAGELEGLLKEIDPTPIDPDDVASLDDSSETRKCPTCGSVVDAVKIEK